MSHSNFQDRYISEYVLEFLRADFLFLKCIRSNTIIEGIEESGKEISLKMMTEQVMGCLILLEFIFSLFSLTQTIIKSKQHSRILIVFSELDLRNNRTASVY